MRSRDEALDEPEDVVVVGVAVVVKVGALGEVVVDELEEVVFVEVAVAVPVAEAFAGANEP